MKKERSEAVVAEQTYYDFYCDKCGKFINTSMESENGTYYSFGKTKGKLKLSTESNKAFKLQFRAELCAECYDSLVHEMDTAIEGLLQKYGANAVTETNF
jgi:hypothetical protein